MQFSSPIRLHNNLTITRASFLSSHRSISLVLNIILCFVTFIFIFCLTNLIRQEKQTSIIHTKIPKSVVDETYTSINLTRNTGYYDFEVYLINNTFRKENKTRRYFYIDLGCFDGRDADYFVHFHLEEITRYGTLNIIAFEPDPINFSACKLAQQKRSFIPTKIYSRAVWTDNGQIRYATEKGQKSKIDSDSALYVRSIDFSTWLKENFLVDDYVYIKFTIEGAEIDVLEKMVLDGSLTLVDTMEIEWTQGISPELEPRRVVLECMFDNFGMDFIYIINPVDLKHAYNVNDTFSAVPKDRAWYVFRKI
jgi:FkbM family methyltransferase